MFNCYLELNEDNVDLLFVNAVLENLKYGIISLDAMFRQEITDDFYAYDDYTFYFFHMQSVLTAQGNIANILHNDYFQKNREISAERVSKMRKRLGVDPEKYPLVGNKAFRNTNMHFDERYFSFKDGVGDYNILKESTQPDVRKEILSTPHLRTIDLVNWQYITYDRQKKQITLDLRRLRKEMYDMYFAICTCSLMSSYDSNNPRCKLIKAEDTDDDQL